MSVRGFSWAVMTIAVVAALGGCVVNPVPTPITTGGADKGGESQVDNTRTTNKDAGTQNPPGADTSSSGDSFTGGVGAQDATSADASEDFDVAMPADATGLAGDATALAADPTESGS